MDKRRKAIYGIVASVATVAALAGCGSSGNSGSSGSNSSSTVEATPASSSSTAKAPTGAAIKIGLICGCTGPNAAALGQIPTLVSVWEKATNAAGGINGHPVQVVVKDDQSNPSKTATAARQLVQEKVLAAVGNFSVTSTIYSPYFEKQHVPQIGGSSSDMKSGTGTNYFPSGGNVLGGDYGVAKTAKDAGLKKLAVIYCAEFPACAGVGDLYKKIAADVGGIQVASTGAISATAPNYIPQCLKIKQSGADSMYIADSPPPVVKMIDDCAKQSVKLKSFEQAGIVTPDLAKSPSAQGLQSMYGNMPLSDTSTPGGKYVNQMIDKYAPDMRSAPNWNESLTAVWAALELFKKAATAGNVGPNSTRDDVYNAMYNIKNETLGGLSPALTFVKGKGNHIGCWYTATIKGGKVVADGSTPQCVPAAQVPALEKALGA